MDIAVKDYQNTVRNYKGTITRKQAHWIGKYSAPYSHHYSGEDGDDYEYEPGGLYNSIYQETYLVTDDFSNHQFKVHPLDVTPI